MVDLKVAFGELFSPLNHILYRFGVSASSFFFFLFSITYTPWHYLAKGPLYAHSPFWLEVTVNSSNPDGTKCQVLSPRVLQRLMVPCLDSRIHVNTWNYKEHADWMKHIKPGHTITVSARHHFQRPLFIESIVSFIRIDVYCAWWFFECSFAFKLYTFQERKNVVQQL